MLAVALEENSTLKELNLELNAIGDEGAMAIARSLEEKLNHSVEVLNLGGNTLSNVGTTALAEALEDNGTLHTLILSSNEIESAEQLAESISEVNIDLLLQRLIALDAFVPDLVE